MRQYAVMLLTLQQQGALLQPVEQFVAVGGFQNREGPVLFFRRCAAMARGNQVEVVVAEYAVGGVTEILDQTQHPEGVRAACHQITGKPEPVTGGIEGNRLQQIFQCFQAALHITDCIQRHEVGLSAGRAEWRA